MSGASSAAAVSGQAVVVNPLSIGAGVTGGSVPLHVTAASGDTNGIRMFSASASGGTPPYSYSWTRQNGANKTALESSTGSTAYVSYSGMLVGEYQSTTASCRVTDATGAHATSSTIVIGIQRDS